MIGFFRSMSGRVFLVLLLGILGSAALTWWLAVGERQRAIGQFREARALELAEQFILTMDAIPADGRSAFAATSRRFGLRVEPAAPQDARAPAAAPDNGFVAALGARLGPPYRLAPLPPAAAECPAPRGRRGRCEAVMVTLADGSAMRMTLLLPPSPRLAPRAGAPGWLALFLVCIGLLAYVVARMTMQPLKQLAQAARNLGDDIGHAPLAARGATEIRQASMAFNTMQARIREHISQRTLMLAAITHDLQTPLTRLRLRLEKVQDPALREKLVEDLAATQAMVREGLELARSMDSAEPPQPLDLDSLLDSVCADASEAGQPVTLDGKTGMSVLARPTALRRCLVNLVDNAVKYGRFAQVTASKEMVDGRCFARILVRDGGPGIANQQLQQVFEPFYRIEGSRSRKSGGTGLGLTIARNIARQHGGNIELANHPAGGLQASLLLPEHEAAIKG